MKILILLFLMAMTIPAYAQLGSVTKGKPKDDVTMPNSLYRDINCKRTLGLAAMDGKILDHTFTGIEDVASSWKVNQAAHTMTGFQKHKQQGTFTPSVQATVVMNSTGGNGAVAAPPPDRYLGTALGKYIIQPNPKPKSGKGIGNNEKKAINPSLSIIPSSENPNYPTAQANYRFSDDISRQPSGEILFTVDCTAETIDLVVPKQTAKNHSVETYQKQLERTAKSLTSKNHSFTIRPNTLADIDDISVYADIWALEMKSAYMMEIDQKINTIP